VLLLSQFTDPISLILLFSAGVSLFLQDATDAVIILIILFASGFLSFWQEYSASDAVQKLLARVQVTATVVRGGAPQEIPLGGVVPGDMVVLHAGDLIPGDCLLLEAKDLFVDEAALTGETYPAEKAVGVLSASTPLAQRKNTLFLGTHVVSGEAQAVVIAVGTATEFGKISQNLKVRPPATEFERGIRRFGTLLLEITFLLVVSIFAINVYFHRSVLDSLLFALALAVGLTPQLLPAIISINLASGAKRMANQQVIVRRLNSIENFGSMNVLCSDKTGTLTEGVMKVCAILGPDEQPREKVLLYGYLNASFQSGFPNPTDLAIQIYARERLDISAYQKQDEISYDFLRKRLTIVVRKDDYHLMVTKGAVANVLAICATAELAPGNVVGIVEAQAQIQRAYQHLSAQGFHTLGVAYKEGTAAPVTKDDEKGMTFLGFLVFEDPPRLGIIETIA
jgi:Mg2+-importing ATPase